MKTIHLDANGDMVKTRIAAYQNGPDDQDFEEVLLSDREYFGGTTEKKDEDQIPY